MLRKGIIILGLVLVSVLAYGQKTERDYLRSGNKLYKDSTFVKAEVDYRKALELEPKSTDAIYNLGNSLLMQQKAKEAMEQYEAASHIEKDKMKLAQIYHNMGVILQSSKQLPQCIEAYKEALRNNPKDDNSSRIKTNNKNRSRSRSKTRKNRIKTNKTSNRKTSSKTSNSNNSSRTKCQKKMPNNC